MPGKDYYQILQVHPSASFEEIKKAYRLLALEFHPDKNNSQWAAQQFVIIQEAYEILSDPRERKKYDTERFLSKGSLKRIATTPEELRWMSHALTAQIRNRQPDHINRDRLAQHIKALLSVYHIQLLEEWGDAHQNRLVIHDILYCLQYVERKDAVAIINILQNIKGLNEEDISFIQSFLSVYTRKHYWNKYKVWGALLLSILFCWLMYMISR